MLKRALLPFMTAAAVTLSGCYNVRLSPIEPIEATPVAIAAHVEIPPESATYTYKVQSVAAGAANTFTIHVGEALVQYAEAYLKPTFATGDDATIRIKVLDFSVHDFEAHIRAQFSVERDTSVVFHETYEASGSGYFARTVFGGVFAMKSSMRRTTDEALRSLFEKFLADVMKEHGSWTSPLGSVPTEETGL